MVYSPKEAEEFIKEKKIREQNTRKKQEESRKAEMQKVSAELAEILEEKIQFEIEQGNCFDSRVYFRIWFEGKEQKALFHFYENEFGLELIHMISNLLGKKYIEAGWKEFFFEVSVVGGALFVLLEA